MTTITQEFAESRTPRTRGFQAGSIPEAVAVQAAAAPEAVAVAAGCRVLSYRELNARADRVARHLRSLGVGTDVLVGLCLPRCLDMVIGALGIWKAGGAYVPLDPSYPSDRLAFMLDDAQARVMITSPCVSQRLPPVKTQLVDIGGPEIGRQPADAPDVRINPKDLAYVIYTSGSTGAPKGVEITHGSLGNLVAWHLEAFSVTCSDRASHVAGLGFDAAVWELWPYVVAGASVHLADEVTRNSAELLRDWLLATGITISFVPTPLAERLLTLRWPRDASLRFLLTGGDVLHHHPPANLPFALVNNYGPTECTVVATSGAVFSDLQLDARPPIGGPINNTHIYLLDEARRPVPAGAPGEVYVGGASLARGYRNRPDLTDEKFISDPFNTEPGGRLYRTGDVARILPDGQFAFLGRVDGQIKIRGYRIEPNEVISVLNRHPHVQESLVVADADSLGDKRLLAYVVLAAGADVGHTNLRDFLRNSLPEYMLPSAFVRLEAFPLTPHGKIDRSSLPAPDPANTLQGEVSPPPRTQTEARITAILSELLGLEEIGADDNFFMLGGHSLLGAQLIARLRAAFGVELALRTLFETPTVAALAAEIERLSARELVQEPDSAEVCAAPQPCTARA